MGEHLTDEDRELLGGPTGPWIRDDWDQLLGYVEHIVAAHIARATADAEIVRAEWERQYGYAAEAAERFRKRAAEAEARLAAVRGLTSLGAQAGSINGRLYIFTSDLIAALNSAPTTDADGRDERRDGAGWGVNVDNPAPGHVEQAERELDQVSRWERG